MTLTMAEKKMPKKRQNNINVKNCSRVKSGTGLQIESVKLAYENKETNKNWLIGVKKSKM